MIKRLARHGNSLALVIDKGILDLLGIEADTPLEITTDGRALVVTPVTDPARRAAFHESLERVNRRHARAFERLAE